jgi:RNA polymerase sigma-70 factor (ECF subfamily)
MMSTDGRSSVTDKLSTQELGVDRIFREHYHLVYHTAYRMLRVSADAEDVLQTIVLRFLRRKHPPDLEKNAKGYFYRAAVNLSLHTLRSRRRYQFIADIDRLGVPIVPSVSNSVEYMHQRLEEAIECLNPEAAQILRLRYVKDFSDADIAKLLGTSRGTIAVRLFRSRTRLKKLMCESSLRGRPIAGPKQVYLSTEL